MNKLKNQVRPVFAYAFALALVLGASNAMAETIKKLHTSPQKVLDTTTQALYGLTVSSNGTSSTIDLSGGDLDKISFGISLASAAAGNSGPATIQSTVKLQTSPDGGTTWFDVYSVNVTTNGTTANTTGYMEIPVFGTKARFTNTLTAGNTFYSYKIWATPSVK